MKDTKASWIKNKRCRRKNLICKVVLSDYNHILKRQNQEAIKTLMKLLSKSRERFLLLLLLLLQLFQPRTKIKISLDRCKSSSSITRIAICTLLRQRGLKFKIKLVKAIKMLLALREHLKMLRSWIDPPNKYKIN